MTTQQQPLLTLRCQRCAADVVPALRWRTITGGSRVIEASCPRCRKWLRWLLQTPENVARTVTDDPPRPQQTLFGDDS